MIKVGTIVQTPAKLIGVVISIQENFIIAFDRWKGGVYPLSKLSEVTSELDSKTQKEITDAKKYYRINSEIDGSEERSGVST